MISSASASTFRRYTVIVGLRLSKLLEPSPSWRSRRLLLYSMSVLSQHSICHSAIISRRIAVPMCGRDASGLHSVHLVNVGAALRSSISDRQLIYLEIGGTVHVLQCRGCPPPSHLQDSGREDDAIQSPGSGRSVVLHIPTLRQPFAPWNTALILRHTTRGMG